MPNETTLSVKAPTKTPWGAVLLFCMLFFIFGFVTWLNGPLITFVKLAFNLTDVEAFLVPSTFYLSYFFLSIPAAFILRKTGMKQGMALGLFVMAVGAAGFGQFATMRIFPGALTSLFIIGAGVSLLQTASNPYISVLGPIESGAQRIAVMGIFNKFAGFLAPIVVGTFILHGMSDFDASVKAAADPAAKEAILNAFAARIHTPYLMMAGLLAILAVFTWFSPCRRLAMTPTRTTARAASSPISRCSSVFSPSSSTSASRSWPVTPSPPTPTVSACRST